MSSAWAALSNAKEPFTGSFDGENHTITFHGFKLAGLGADEEVAGLFGVIVNATVCNLNLVNSGSLDGLIGPKQISFGLLAGSANLTTIYGCSSTLAGSLNISKRILLEEVLFAGALVGSINRSTITSCNVNMSLIAVQQGFVAMGGIAGSIYETHIVRCTAIVANEAVRATNAYIGGLTGFSFAGDQDTVSSSSNEKLGSRNVGAFSDANESSITSYTVDVKLQFTDYLDPNVGGLIGESYGKLNLSDCNVKVLITSYNSTAIFSFDVGGIIGEVFNGEACIRRSFVSMTTIIKLCKRYSPVGSIAGLVGNVFYANCTIDQAASIISTVISGYGVKIGGIVGQNMDGSLTVSNSGSLGTLSVSSRKSEECAVGGIVGRAENLIMQQCFFAGAIAVKEAVSEHSSEVSLVGGMIGVASHAQLNRSFVLANTTICGRTVYAGAIGKLIESSATACYTTANITASASEDLFLGGMAGYMGTGSSIRNSVAMGKLFALGNARSGSVGGLVGNLNVMLETESLLWSYSWTELSMNMIVSTDVALGGLAGSVAGPAKISSCLAYGTITSVSQLRAGLLVGKAMLTNETAGASRQLGAEFLVAYIVPSGALQGVRIVGVNSGSTFVQSFCAGYAGTLGCTPLMILNTREFLKSFDFVDIFQLDSSIANGSLALLTVPVPRSNAPIHEPRFKMPSKPFDVLWSSSNWITNSTTLHGLPYLSTIDYAPYCGTYIDCHGIGTSPIDALCSPGWASPPWNTTALIDNLHRCNVYANASTRNFGAQSRKFAKHDAKP